MIGQGELRTPHASRLTPPASCLSPHAARGHKQKLYVPPSGDIISFSYVKTLTSVAIWRPGEGGGVLQQSDWAHLGSHLTLSFILIYMSNIEAI